MAKFPSQSQTAIDTPFSPSHMLLDSTQQAVKHAGLKRQLAFVLRSISDASTPSQPVQFAFPPRAFSTSIRRRTDELSHTSGGGPNDSFERLEAVAGVKPRKIEGQFTYGTALRESPTELRSNRRIARIDERPSRRRRPRKEPIPVAPAEARASITSEDIQAAVLAEGRSPELVEVYESINALRPATPVLSSEQIEALAVKLIDGYNKQQLTGYLRLFGPAKGKRRRTAPLARPTLSTWRSASGSSSEPVQEVQSTAQSPKHTIVDGIVKSAWNIKVEGLIQEQGQMDVQLPAKQIELMCLQVQSEQGMQPFWRLLLVTPELAKAVKITPLPGDGIMRLEGTKEDATQVIDELLAACTGGLATVHIPASILAENVAAKELFADQAALDGVQSATFCLIKMLENGNASISSLRLQQCFDARRLLYSLIDAETTDVTKYLISRRFIPIPTVSGKKVDLTYMPVVMPAIGGVPNKTRYRLSTVKPKQLEPVKDVPAVVDVGSITRKMEKRVEYADKAFSLATSQRHKGIGQWRASIGALIQHQPLADVTPRLSAFTTHAPFKESILSLFEPWIKLGSKKASPRTMLSAYLTPIQQPDAPPLPNIRLQFSTLTTWTDHQPKLRHMFSGIAIEFGQQHIQIPLPDRVADLQLERSVPYHLNVKESALEAIFGSKPLMSLIQNIKTNGRKTTVGEVQRAGVYQMAFSKDAMKAVGIELGDDAPAINQYAFSHVEIRERMDFVPRRRAETQRHPLQHLLEGWAENTSLAVYERDGGQFGGRQREMFIRSVPDGRPNQDRMDDGSHWYQQNTPPVTATEGEAPKEVQEAPQADQSAQAEAPTACARPGISTFTEAEALTKSALCIVEMLSAYRSVPLKT